MELETEDVDSLYQSLIQTEDAMFSRYKELVRKQINRFGRFEVDIVSRHLTNASTSMLENNLDIPVERGINECTQTESVQNLLDSHGAESLGSYTTRIAKSLEIYLEELSSIRRQWGCEELVESTAVTATYCAIEQESRSYLDLLTQKIDEWTTDETKKYQPLLKLLENTTEHGLTLSREVRTLKTDVASDIIAILNVHRDVLLDHRRRLQEGGITLLSRVALVLKVVCTAIETVVFEIIGRIPRESKSASISDTVASSSYLFDSPYPGETWSAKFAMTAPADTRSELNATDDLLQSPKRSAFSDPMISELQEKERELMLGRAIVTRLTSEFEQGHNVHPDPENETSDLRYSGSDWDGGEFRDLFETHSRVSKSNTPSSFDVNGKFDAMFGLMFDEEEVPSCMSGCECTFNGMSTLSNENVHPKFGIDSMLSGSGSSLRNMYPSSVDSFADIRQCGISVGTTASSHVSSAKASSQSYIKGRESAPSSVRSLSPVMLFPKTSPERSPCISPVSSIYSSNYDEKMTESDMFHLSRYSLDRNGTALHETGEIEDTRSPEMNCKTVDSIPRSSLNESIHAIAQTETQRIPDILSLRSNVPSPKFSDIHQRLLGHDVVSSTPSLKGSGTFVVTENNCYMNSNMDKHTGRIWPECPHLPLLSVSKTKDNEDNKTRLPKENEDNKIRLFRDNENNRTRLPKDNKNNRIRLPKDNEDSITRLPKDNEDNRIYLYKPNRIISNVRSVQLEMVLTVIVIALLIVLVINYWTLLFSNAREPNLYSILENLEKFTTLNHYGMPPI
ncbi:hypothetical protein ScPMuIL_012102 [Solemya velum]